MNKETGGLDRSIFTKIDFKSEDPGIFGEKGKITKSGRFYSLNRGKDILGFHLVVLDTHAKTLNAFIFDDDAYYLSRSAGDWKATKHSLNPKERQPDLITENTLFEMASDFLSKMTDIFPTLGKAESEKVSAAINKGIKPLLAHLNIKRNQANALNSGLSKLQNF